MEAVIKWTNPSNTMFNLTLYNIIIDDTVLHHYTAHNTRSVTITPLNRTKLYNFFVSQINIIIIVE